MATALLRAGCLRSISSPVEITTGIRRQTPGVGCERQSHGQPRQEDKCREQTNMPDVAYILGHSPAEIGRLIFQAGVLKPITERLLREAGVAPGMRVLDLGCGTGDVALLAAELVGPNGAVVGIDRNGDALSAACSRARGAGYANIEFREGAAEDF